MVTVMARTMKGFASTCVILSGNVLLVAMIYLGISVA